MPHAAKRGQVPRVPTNSHAPLSWRVEYVCMEVAAKSSAASRNAAMATPVLHADATVLARVRTHRQHPKEANGPLPRPPGLARCKFCTKSGPKSASSTSRPTMASQCAEPGVSGPSPPPGTAAT